MRMRDYARLNKAIAHDEQWHFTRQLSFEFDTFEQRLKAAYERLVDQGEKKR